MKQKPPPMAKLKKLLGVNHAMSRGEYLYHTCDGFLFKMSTPPPLEWDTARAEKSSNRKH
jgi:hypothetical protein